MSCNSPPSLHSRHQAFLAPAYFKHAWASEPCISVSSTSTSSSALHQILHIPTHHSSLSTNAPNQNSTSEIYPTGSMLHLLIYFSFYYLVSLNPLGVCISIDCFYRLECKLHESRNFNFFTTGVKTSAPRTMPTIRQELKFGLGP